MEDAFTIVTLSLFVAGLLSMAGIVQEVLPRLNEKDQICLRGWTDSKNTYGLDGAIRKSWDQHVQRFPKSRKRMLFACLLIAFLLSGMAYPLWLTFASR